MSTRTLLALIVCNAVWSLNPAMGKILLHDFKPADVALLRYVGALLGYLAFFPLFGEKHPFVWPGRKKDRLLMLGLAFMPFCFTPLTQMTGLDASRATDNALIVAMEPLVTVLLAWIFLKEHLTGYDFLSFGVALAGFFLLSGLTREDFVSGMDSHTLGNFIILLSLIGDASYSIFSRKLMPFYPAVRVFGTAILIGVGLLIVADLQWGGALVTDFSKGLTWRHLIAILWVGPIGTTITYLVWVFALAETTVAHVALTLFVQPVLGAVWGHTFLGESLSWFQLVGGLLIILAVCSQNFARRDALSR